MPIDPHDRTRLAAAGSSGVSDAMERLGLSRTAITGFRCSHADAPAMVGRALTVRQLPKHHPGRHDERLVRHDEIGKTIAQPGDFVVVDAGGRTDIAGWGGNHTRRCSERGVAGVLVNGATRDLATIRAGALPVFHLGTSPVASRWDQETAEVNGAIVVAGVQIRASDVLVADDDGLIVIAPSQLAVIMAELG